MTNSTGKCFASFRHKIRRNFLYEHHIYVTVAPISCCARISPAYLRQHMALLFAHNRNRMMSLN